jgi:ElaB/YqjD/DUF883 family membrane-anchored ribosome-binding protein
MDRSITKSLKATINNDPKYDNITPAQIIAHANEILQFVNSLWDRKYRKKNLREQNLDPKIGESILKKTRKKYPDFALSYPIILRYMCELKMYSPQVFEKFLDYIQNNPWQSENEYLDRMTHYVTLLYRHYYPELSKNKIKKIKAQVKKLLYEERDKLKTMAQNIEREVDEKKNNLQQNWRRDLYEIVSSFTEKDLQLAGTVCCITPPQL